MWQSLNHYSGIYLFCNLFPIIFRLANIPSKIEPVIPSVSKVMIKRILDKKYKPLCILVMNRDWYMGHFESWEPNLSPGEL